MPALERGNAAKPLAQSGHHILFIYVREGHVSSRPLKTETSDIPNVRRGQRGSTENPVGSRILSVLGAKDRKQLARDAGLSESTLGDAITRGPARTDNAVRIAGALGVSLDWLLTGTGIGGPPAAAVDLSKTDFVGLPRYDLREISEEAAKGNRIETIPFRRDWLNRRIGTSSGLWVTELPSTYEELGLFEGDAVICSDIPRSQAPPDNTICFFLGEGLFVARYRNHWAFEAGDMAGPRVGPLDLVEHGTQPIARIRARILTNL